MTKLIKFIALLALLSAQFAAAGLSSDQALDLIGGKQGYLNQGESAKLLFSTPLEVDGERYWLAYTYQTTSPETRNLFLAVNDNTGMVERDAGRLGRIITVAQKMDVIDQLKQRKASLDDVEQFLLDSKDRTKSVEDNYFKLVKQQLELKYQSVSFTDIEASLQALKNEQDKLGEAVREARDYKGQFDIYGTDVDFENFFNQNNQTLYAFYPVARAADEYQNKLLLKSEEAANSPDLNFSGKEEITSALEKLTDVGDYATFKASTLDPAVRASETMVQRIDKLVNNSVDSALYRVAKKDAENAYTATLKAEMTSLLAASREPELRTCGADVDQLKSLWKEVAAVMENPSNATRDAYETVPGKVGQVQTLAADASDKLSTCTSQQTTVKPQADYGWLQNLAIVAIVIAVIVFGYRKWRQSQLEAEE